MADVVDKATRSRMMAGIRGKITKPELLIRRELHARGLRFRLHTPELPGKPDLVFPKYRCVIFVHGCFWHGHECVQFRWPKSNRAFWREKIARNRVRDQQNCKLLKAMGWRVIPIWECWIKKTQKQSALQHTIDNLAAKVTGIK